MRFVCDAPGGKIWFGIETEGEADAESVLMGHAVGKYYKRAREDAEVRAQQESERQAREAAETSYFARLKY